MSEFIRRDILKDVPFDIPLPIAQEFIDSANRIAREEPSREAVSILTEATLGAIVALEARLSKTQAALGLKEVR